MVKAKSVDRHTSPRVVFHLPDELLRRLERVAARGPIPLTKSQVIRAAIEEYLKREEKRK